MMNEQPGNPLSIGYFADGPWSHRAFEKLITDKSISIKFIVPRSDTTDQTLKNFAAQYGIDYLCPVKINSPEFLETAAAYACDLFVSMSFNQIFRKDILRVPPMGVINCHAGKLPFYRGRNILNWALINDEKEFGITVHYVDEGIDTGDIIRQVCHPITDADTYATLLERAFTGCADVLVDAIKLIQQGNHRRISQASIHPVGFYCGIRKQGDEVINWNQSSRRIFNFIRAVCAPGPRATSFLHGTPVSINRAVLIPGAPEYIGTPGQLLSKTASGFLVKTADSFIEIAEIETTAKLKVGEKLT